MTQEAGAPGLERLTDDWEMFSDAAYYDMWCVRRVGNAAFGEGFHVASKGEAEALVALLSSPSAVVIDEAMESRAWNCDEWPEWLWKIVGDANDVADRLDMSSEQAMAYAVLAALQNAGGEQPAPKGDISGVELVNGLNNGTVILDRNLKPAPAPNGVSGAVREALETAYDYVNRVSGAAMGLAMSGSNHPNWDGVLMDYSREGMTLATSIREALSQEPAPSARGER